MIFWHIFNVNDVTRRFCDIATFAETFYDLKLDKNLYAKFEPPMISIAYQLHFIKKKILNAGIFFEIWSRHHYTRH